MPARTPKGVKSLIISAGNQKGFCKLFTRRTFFRLLFHSNRSKNFFGGAQKSRPKAAYFDQRG